MENNNYFPNNGIVETYQSKLDALQKLRTEVKIDGGILDLVNGVNEIPLFLSSSSCEGQNGNSNSSHWKYSYIGIGVLYNQIPIIEELASRLKLAFEDKVVCKLKYEVTAAFDDTNSDEELYVFRTFLIVEIPNQSMLPEVKMFIHLFSKTIPRLEDVLEKYEVIENDELKKCRTVMQLIKQIEPYADDMDDVSRIYTLLQQSPFLNVDIHSSLVIKFETPMNYLVGDLFRLLTASTKGEITAFCTLKIDASNQLTRYLLIHLYNPDHYQLVGSILKLFIDSENGRILS